MRKLFYLLMVLGLVTTTACDPMEDIHDVIDAEKEIIVSREKVAAFKQWFDGE